MNIDFERLFYIKDFVKRKLFQLHKNKNLSVVKKDQRNFLHDIDDFCKVDNSKLHNLLKQEIFQVHRIFT